MLVLIIATRVAGYWKKASALLASIDNKRGIRYKAVPAFGAFWVWGRTGPMYISRTFLSKRCLYLAHLGFRGRTSPVHMSRAFLGIVFRGKRRIELEGADYLD